MNVELMRIAKKKLEQMGATVHGVLVKNEAGAWAAVSEAGRVMWLDGFEGQASSVQPCRFHGDDAEACETYSGDVPCEPEEEARASEGEGEAVGAVNKVSTGEYEFFPGSALVDMPNGIHRVYASPSASADDQYPDCDTCSKAMDYMPWHYSKGEERHLHACDECWPSVNPSARAVPEPFILGNSYRTVAGDLVRFVKVHNEGSSYETMEDEAGVNRYTNRPGDMGRVTARPVDYPGNVRPLYTHNGEQGDGWIWVTKDHPGPHGGNWITYRPDAPKEAQVTTTWYDPNHNGWSGKYRVAAYMCRPKPPTEREDDA